MTSYIQFKKIAVLDELTRINNSINGNPRYKVTFKALDIFKARTKIDASYAYKICPFWEGQAVEITYHFTQRGNIVIDDMEKV